MDKLAEAINNKLQKDGKILCKDALEIANELNISPATVGKELNKLKIKIKGCQLGCF